MKNRIYFILLVFCFSCQKNESVKFAVCTDVHQDLFYDASSRLQDFINSAEKNNADFIIQLGDFCMPFEKNEPFLDIWKSFEGLKYHVLGNHDMDVSPKILTQDFWGMENAIYSFDQGIFHFIVLDANFYKDGTQLIPYSNGNYFKHLEHRSYIPESHIEWLKNDLEQTNKFTIVFSHQSLAHWGGVKNREEIRKVFEIANKNRKKVIACFNGHDHQDRHAEIAGIHYLGLNSTSYAWGGKNMEYSGRFPASIEEKYTNLKYTLPYQKSVFAIVEINLEGEIIIEGIQSDFIKPGPDELGAESNHFSAKISNRTLKY